MNGQMHNFMWPPKSHKIVSFIQETGMGFVNGTVLQKMERFNMNFGIVTNFFQVWEFCSKILSPRKCKKNKLQTSFKLKLQSF